jgi:uncharacterized membrane protein YciS (DUF1049 family)
MDTKLTKVITATAVVIAVVYTAGLTVGSFIHKLNDELSHSLKNKQTKPKVQQKTEAVVSQTTTTQKAAVKTPRKPRQKVVKTPAAV